MGCHHDAHASDLSVGVAAGSGPLRAVRPRPRRSRSAVRGRRAGFRRPAQGPRASSPRAFRRRLPERQASAAGAAPAGARAARDGRRRAGARRLPPLQGGGARRAAGRGRAPPEPALDAFRRFKAAAPAAQRLEGRFWEGEALYRSPRFAEAPRAYEDVLRQDAASPLAPDASYGRALCDLELRRPEAAVKGFRDFLATWPDNSQAGPATFYLAQTLVDLKRASDAVPLLTGYAAKYPKSRLVPDAQYLLGTARIAAGERDAGMEDLKAFIAAHPSHPMAAAARQGITGTLAKSGNKTQQQSAYTQLMQQSPPTPEGLYDAGLIAGRLGQPQNQEAAWRRLRKEFPNHPMAHQAALELARTSFKKKSWQDAVTQAKAAGASGDDAVRAEAFLLAGESELKLNRL